MQKCGPAGEWDQGEEAPRVRDVGDSATTGVFVGMGKPDWPKMDVGGGVDDGGCARRREQFEARSCH